jgi:hypothetical protein
MLRLQGDCRGDDSSICNLRLPSNGLTTSSASANALLQKLRVSLTFDAVAAPSAALFSASGKAVYFVDVQLDADAAQVASQGLVVADGGKAFMSGATALCISASFPDLFVVKCIVLSCAEFSVSCSQFEWHSQSARSGPQSGSAGFQTTVSTRGVTRRAALQVATCERSARRSPAPACASARAPPPRSRPPTSATTKSPPALLRRRPRPLARRRFLARRRRSCARSATSMVTQMMKQRTLWRPRAARRSKCAPAAQSEIPVRFRASDGGLEGRRTRVACSASVTAA